VTNPEKKRQSGRGQQEESIAAIIGDVAGKPD